jgi:hypothetical protein
VQSASGPAGAAARPVMRRHRLEPVAGRRS